MVDFVASNLIAWWIKLQHKRQNDSHWMKTCFLPASQYELFPEFCLNDLHGLIMLQQGNCVSARRLGNLLFEHVSLFSSSEETYRNYRRRIECFAEGQFQQDCVGEKIEKNKIRSLPSDVHHTGLWDNNRSTRSQAFMWNSIIILMEICADGHLPELTAKSQISKPCYCNTGKHATGILLELHSAGKLQQKPNLWIKHKTIGWNFCFQF